MVARQRLARPERARWPGAVLARVAVALKHGLAREARVEWRDLVVVGADDHEGHSDAPFEAVLALADADPQVLLAHGQFHPVLPFDGLTEGENVFAGRVGDGLEVHGKAGRLTLGRAVLGLTVEERDRGLHSQGVVGHPVLVQLDHDQLVE